MGCGCKSKKINSGDVSEDKGVNKPGKFRLLTTMVVMTTIVILMTPFIIGLLIKMVYDSTYGDGFDIIKLVKKLMGKETNKKEPIIEFEGEINPDDYELVGVENIK